MQELGIGLVNARAAEIAEFPYPSWVPPHLHWSIVGKVGQDEEGYDLYEIIRDTEKRTVPANRLVFLARLAESLIS